MKGRIMAGQADLTANERDLKDYKWLVKEEIEQYVLPQYFSMIKNMLSERWDSGEELENLLYIMWSMV